MQVEAIRQFLSFEQHSRDSEDFEFAFNRRDMYLSKSSISREQYFAALEMLRAHIYRCLVQVAKIAVMKIPKISDNMRYNEKWLLEMYEDPKLQDNAKQ